MPDETPAPTETVPTPLTAPPKLEQSTEKTLTQSEVDRIVADRVQRERQKFADYTDLKNKAAKLDELAEAQKSDLEKAVEAARREGEVAALARSNARLVAAEARALAAGSQFRDAGDAVRFLDLTQVAVSDDGVVDTDAIEKQLKKLAGDKPYLLVEQKPALPTPAQAGIGVGNDGKRLSGVDRAKRYYETAIK